MTKENQLTIFTNINAIWLDENGILNVRSVREGEMDLPEVEKCFEAYRQLGCDQRKVLQLLDLTVPVSITKEAREYVDKMAPDFFIASAIVSDSLAIRIIINFMSFFKPYIPIRMFNKKEDAIEWLMKFRASDQPE